MPLDYEIDPTRQLLTARGYGELTDEDLRDFRDRVRHDARYLPGLDQLLDFRAVTVLLVTAEGVRCEAETPSKYAEPVRRAIIAGTEATFGLARIFQTRRADEAGETRVFRADEWKQARGWLGLDASEADRPA